MGERAPIELKAGKLYMFSEGSYSDYCVQGTFVALRDVPASEVKQIANYIIDQLPPQPGRLNDRYRRAMEADDLVLPTLIRAGILMEVDYEEIAVDDFISMHEKEIPNAIPVDGNGTESTERSSEEGGGGA